MKPRTASPAKIKRCPNVWHIKFWPQGKAMNDKSAYRYLRRLKAKLLMASGVGNVRGGGYFLYHDDHGDGWNIQAYVECTWTGKPPTYPEPPKV